MSALVDCADCGVAFCMSDAHNRRLRESHQTFYCPNGHPNFYPEKTKLEKEVDQLKRSRDAAREGQEAWRREWQETQMRSAELLRDCPLGCGWRSPCHIKQTYNFGDHFITRVRASVALHLSENHGAEIPEPAEDEAVPA